MTTTLIDEWDDKDERGTGDFIVTLSIMAVSVEQADRIFSAQAALAMELSHDSISATVSKNSYDDDEPADESDEYFDEGTMFKVLKAITDQHFTHEVAMEMITALQNAGILFRERR